VNSSYILQTLLHRFLCASEKCCFSWPLKGKYFSVHSRHCIPSQNPWNSSSSIISSLDTCVLCFKGTYKIINKCLFLQINQNIITLSTICMANIAKPEKPFILWGFVISLPVCSNKTTIYMRDNQIQVRFL